MTDKETRKAFNSLYNQIQNCLHFQNYNEIETLLSNLIRNHQNNPVLLISGLRLTWLKRTNIPNWTQSLEQVRGILCEKGLDAEEILRGLIS